MPCIYGLQFGSHWLCPLLEYENVISCRWGLHLGVSEVDLAPHKSWPTTGGRSDQRQLPAYWSQNVHRVDHLLHWSGYCVTRHLVSIMVIRESSNDSSLHWYSWASKSISICTTHSYPHNFHSLWSKVFVNDVMHLVVFQFVHRLVNKVGRLSRYPVCLVFVLFSVCNATLPQNACIVIDLIIDEYKWVIVCPIDVVITHSHYLYITYILY